VRTLSATFLTQFLAALGLCALCCVVIPGSACGRPDMPHVTRVVRSAACRGLPAEALDGARVLVGGCTNTYLQKRSNCCTSMSHVLFCYTCMPPPLVAPAASAGAPSGSQALSIHDERPLAQLLQIKCALFGPTVRLTSVAGHPRQCPTCGYHKARLTAQLAHTRVGVPRLQPSLRCRAACRREKKQHRRVSASRLDA